MSDYDPNYVPKKTYALVGQKAIVLNSQKQFLVLQRSEKSGAGGKWSLPGGALEDKEEPYAGIEREIEEETSLTVTDIKPFSLRTYTTKQNDFVLMVGYKCRAQEEKVTLNWEHDGFKWLAREEALQLELTEDGRFFIEHFDSNG
ncbi:NUDIX domain-containing protein [Candidatus Woesebacteria bacterium]|nr:NUDIX domain-containing protein [Candidatus Woesebacteria bacterium]